jgi:hypothetical protein
MALVTLAILVLPVAAVQGATTAPSRLMVTAKEWSLILSRQSVNSGAARIQLYNAGEDAHDLRLKRVGGTRSITIAETRPGKLTERATTLRRGTWKLWCALPGHEKQGMRATLRVR